MSALPDTETIETVTLPVTESVTAEALAASPDEKLPAVFATPFMIAGMERACAVLLEPLMGSDDVSVGAKIEVTHMAPTPVGATVRCHAQFEKHEGPLYWFHVWAEDDQRRIGKGRIARAIVRSADLMARTA
ncbi:MAG: hypothetical protein AAGL24_02065 [Pseudomonadota bacterium]